MIARLRPESGQALVVTGLFMGVMVAAAAMTLDVGAWYRQHRQAQTTADAAALAGAKSLPSDPATALTTANSYAADNGGGVATGGITFQSTYGPNDTISVKVAQTSPGFFSKLFGVDSVTVHATAVARVALPTEANALAPIVVNKLHPMLAGPGCPCFGTTTTLPLGKTGAPGAFTLLNLDNDLHGTVGASTIADWITDGYSGYLPLNDYFSDPGAKWDNNSIQNAVVARRHSVLLFPVYDILVGSGSNAEYHIIGWVGFYLESMTATGVSGSITGHFTKVIWDGIESPGGSGGQPDFGVRTVALVN